jgi:hypothetical protein
MQWALVDQNQIIQNLIMYDGVSKVVFPEYLTLMQVNSWLKIGDNINLPE